jgi:hypothetical protein
VSSSLGTRYANGVTFWQVWVGGDAGVQHRILDPALDGSLSVKLAPMIDQLGETYGRADATMSLTWRLTTGWAVSGSASGGRVMDGPQTGMRVAGGGAQITWSEGRAWSWNAGVRWDWQDAIRVTPGVVAAAGALRAWDFFTGVTYRNQARF